MDAKLIGVMNKLNKWKGNEDAILHDGSMLICRIPNAAPLNYLHCIYSPLNTLEIEKIETLLKVSLPNDFADFLLSCNGLDIFSNNISIFGLKKNKEKFHFNYLSDPFDIINENLSLNFIDEYYVFASYKEGYDLCFKPNTNDRVYLRKRNSVSVIKEYASFYGWLNHTIDVLSQYFNEEGLLKKEYQSYKTGHDVNIILDLYQVI